jgi:hypothetical protein
LWTPDHVFENQVSLEKVKSTMKDKNDESLLAVKPCCSKTPNSEICEHLGVNNTETKMAFIFEETVQVSVKCPHMEFSAYPLDTQECSFAIKDVKDTLVNVTWRPPVFDETLKMTSLEYSISVKKIKNTGERSGFNLVMKRKVDVYIYTYFFPCGLMVICSWVSFAVKVQKPLFCS